MTGEAATNKRGGQSSPKQDARGIAGRRSPTVTVSAAHISTLQPRYGSAEVCMVPTLRARAMP